MPAVRIAEGIGGPLTDARRRDRRAEEPLPRGPAPGRGRGPVRGRLHIEITGAHPSLSRDDALHTPTTRCTVDGTGRARVLAIAEREGIACTARDLPSAFVGEADGAFVRGTARGLLPVHPGRRVPLRPGRERCRPEVGHRLPATGYRLPATGYRLPGMIGGPQ
ncbi:aminotransferase class IV [Streptomyces somaliensis]|uniref:aminotransferase class IV n=1 Tax=Streptomyces somaliensis TaxID=78355 RepID=UPI0020CE9ABA|nr:aminotransferase class IV [Streptomyces somaliensis]MCP9946852.1 aminotransferase class IV [Streptomyces somaliensis]MCP9963490.1 aminotransferase class IV [Streptomyces somaliensis]